MGYISVQEAFKKAAEYGKNYTDEVAEGKQNKLTAGDNITISGNVISAAGGGNGNIIIDSTASAVQVLQSTDLKTINGNSLVGSGNIVIGGGSGVDVLANKKILFIGDSICEGVNTNGKPYSYWVAQNHTSATVVNMGHGGMTIAKKDGTTNTLYARITSNEYDKNLADADYIVIQGGINDIGNNVKLGCIRYGFGSTFDVTTTCGGMEFALDYINTKKKNTAKVFLMSTYLVPTYNRYKQDAWYRAYSEIASKWGVGFIDAYSLIPTAYLTGDWATELHAPYPVHRDLICPIVEDALCNGTCYGARTFHHYSHVLVELYFHSGTTTVDVGGTFSTADWRINGIDTNGTYTNETSNCTFDTSEVDTSTAGNYKVFYSATKNGISIGGMKEITVTGASTKVLSSISATKTKTSYSVNETLNTNDITVTATYNDSTTSNVTSASTISTNNVDMGNPGTYLIDVSYTEGGLTKTCQISIVVAESPSPSGDWTTPVTISSAWGTGAEIDLGQSYHFDGGTSYTVSFVAYATTNCNIKFQIYNFNSNESLTANTEKEISITSTSSATGNISVLNAIGTGGTFPTDVKIKNFTLTSN